MPALVGGQRDGLFVDAGNIAPQVNAGTLRALAVAADQRSSALPDVPTMGEAGFPGVVGEVWFGLVASARAPPDIVTRLREALAATHADAVYQDKLARQHASLGEPGPQALARLIKSENAKWRAIVDAAGIRFD